MVEGTGEQEELPGSGDRQPRAKIIIIYYDFRQPRQKNYNFSYLCCRQCHLYFYEVDVFLFYHDLGCLRIAGYFVKYLTFNHQ